MSYAPDNSPPDAPLFDFQAAADRTNAPGILLIVLGIFNLLMGGLVLAQAIQLANTPVEDYEKQVKHLAAFYKQMAKQYLSPQAAEEFAASIDSSLGNQPPEERHAQMLATSFGTGGVLSVVGLVIVIGGYRMRLLRSYGLSIAAAVLAMIPFLSCSACCGLGEGIGLWAFIVLMQNHVRLAFR